MHLYALVRGRRSLVRRFFENCEDIFLPWFKQDNGENVFINLIPRKVELVEFVFPEKYLPEVLKTIEYKNNSEQYGMRKSVLRKALDAKEVPKINNYENIIKLGCRDGERVLPKNVAVHIIGIKEDKKNEQGIELL